MDKLCAAKKEHAAAEMSLRNARKGPLDAPSLADAYRREVRAASLLPKLTSVAREQNEEGVQRSQPEMVKDARSVKSLEEEALRTATPQGAFPNLPGGQEPSPGSPFPGAALVPPLHSGLAAARLPWPRPPPPDLPGARWVQGSPSLSRHSWSSACWAWPSAPLWTASPDLKNSRRQDTPRNGSSSLYSQNVRILSYLQREKSTEASNPLRNLSH